MKSILLFSVYLLTFLLGRPVNAQHTASKDTSALIYHSGRLFWIEPPAAWTIDGEAGKNDGPITVLYRTGESWSSGGAVMYASVMIADSGNTIDVRTAFARDSSDWLTKTPDVHITPAQPITTQDGQTATVRVFRADNERSYDAVAYIPDTGRVWLLVLTARLSALFSGAYSDFVRLVQSYTRGPDITHK